MKKINLIIIFFIFFINNLVIAEDKFIGKWISEETNSVFEIKFQENQYKMYILYSGRFFKTYENTIDSVFEKKGTSYKGYTVVVSDNYDEFNSKAKFKIKKGKLIVTVKDKYPNNNKKFKFISTYRKFTDSDKYLSGEVLFGVKIGDKINNYKTISNFNLGNNKIGYIPAITIEAPKKIDDFGTYVVQVNEDTNQIFAIRGYLKSNSSNQSYGKCMNGIDPYRNYVLDKYSDKFLVADYNALITKKDKIGSKDKIYTYTNHFKFYDKNYREIYSFYAGCFEGDLGQYVGYMGINHKDLYNLDFRKKLNDTNNNKKAF